MKLIERDVEFANLTTIENMCHLVEEKAQSKLFHFIIQQKNIFITSIRVKHEKT